MSKSSINIIHIDMGLVAKLEDGTKMKFTKLKSILPRDLNISFTLPEGIVLEDKIKLSKN